MPQLLVRNVSQAAVEGLKRNAARRGLSAEAAHRDLIEREYAGDDHAAWWAEADRLRAETAGRVSGDSTDDIRAARDER